jgi:hypothetical protein
MHFIYALRHLANVRTSLLRHMRDGNTRRNSGFIARENGDGVIVHLDRGASVESLR